MGLLAKGIGYLLSFIYKFANNYGVSVILLTILVRILLLPLYDKQNKYSAAMADLQPKIQEIQTRYANDRETMNEKMNELYSKANVSPTAGCLPLVIQMPIIIGLFTLLRNPLLYMSGNAMATAVHESFLWMSDLSQPDSWILPILAGVTTFFTSAQSSATDTTGSMKAMQYFFPVMIFLLGRSFPSALALYWAIGNVISIIQTAYFKRKKKAQDWEREVEKEAIKRSKRKR